MARSRRDHRGFLVALLLILWPGIAGAEGVLTTLAGLPDAVAEGFDAFVASLPDGPALRDWADRLVPVLPVWLPLVAALFLAWRALRSRRAALAVTVRTAARPRQRIRALANYALTAVTPVVIAGALLLGWAAFARPPPPQLRLLLLLTLPFMAAMVTMAGVAVFFTLLTLFGRRADRETTRHLPPQLGTVTALLVAAFLLREGVRGLSPAFGDATALALETLAALIGLRATWQQRLTFRQLLKVESATPDDDPPTLPEQILAWIADRWHVLGIALILIGIAGRYGIFGAERRFGLVPDLFWSLVLLTAAGIGILLTEKLHGHVLNRMNVRAESGLRDRLALRLGRVLRSGVQIALGLWAAGAIAGLWWQDPRGRVTAALVTTLAALYALWFIWTLVDTLLDWSVSQTRGRGTRIRTLLPFLRNFAFIVVATLAAISVLSNLGVDVAPLLAGAGVVGLAIGIGAQKLVGDVITGIFIIFEDSIAIGETVEAAGKTGVVEGLTIRTLKLRDGDGALHSIPFSSISTLKNNSRGYGTYTVSTTILNPEDTDRALAEIDRIGREIAEDPAWKASVTGPFSLWGVDQITPAGVVIKGAIRSHPNAQWGLGREINRRIALRFSELGILQVQHFPATPPGAPGAPPA
ncbi:mechanosensitive ion channel domain-containing protein [Ruixingdingia sedimenti]|uniref:Mechanosensitive ion channel n=1 Tax=Ruixingdingia sedimenti TaxID=3073604 RepID=A0ABU1FCY0_9RHOB|nr:mechanosensitive ion channel domain-containing protein [Xinfangfangia sp. LG-4]MDR5654712.1 mechanosensitive ion channel [Xinfangfangia sp. LG-4]